jgi:hypothetical protein
MCHSSADPSMAQSASRGSVGTYIHRPAVSPHGRQFRESEIAHWKSNCVVNFRREQARNCATNGGETLMTIHACAWAYSPEIRSGIRETPLDALASAKHWCDRIILWIPVLTCRRARYLVRCVKPLRRSCAAPSFQACVSGTPCSSRVAQARQHPPARTRSHAQA